MDSFIFLDLPLSTLDRLDTLGQRGTKIPMIVQGEGSNLKDIRAINGRAKRKLTRIQLVFNIIEIVKTKRVVKKEKSLWNTYHVLTNYFFKICLSNLGLKQKHPINLV